MALSVMIVAIFSFLIKGVANDNLYLKTLIEVNWFIIGFLFLSQFFLMVEKRRYRANILYLGYAVRAVFIWINTTFDHCIVPGMDSNYMMRSATRIYEGTTNSYLTRYEPLMAAEMRLFGTNEFCICIIQQMVICLGLICFYKICDLYHVDERREKVLGIYYMLQPFSIYFSVTTMRESWYIGFSVISILMLVLWIHSGKMIYYFFALVGTLPTILFHSGHVVFLVGVVALIFVVNYRKHSIIRKGPSKRMLLWWLIFIVMGIAILPKVFSIVGSQYFQDVGNLGVIGAINSWNELGTTYDGGSTYIRNVSYDSLPEIIIAAPYRSILFLFEPLPWRWRGVTDIIAFFTDSLFHIYFVATVISHMVRKRTNDREVMAVCKSTVWIWFLILLIFAFGTMNTGTAIRHRLSLLGFECITIALMQNYMGAKRCG